MADTDPSPGRGGGTDEGTGGEHDRVVAVEDVPHDTTFLFTVHDREGERREAILVRTGDGDEGGGGDDGEGGDSDEDGSGIAAWLNYCQHFTHVSLDKGSGAEMRGDEIVCTDHGAMFEADSGQCTFGPCEGAYLEDLAVETREGEVYLVDPDYSFVEVGGEDDGDLTSTSNVEF